MVAGERSNAIGDQEFFLVEHARRNSAQPFRIHQRSDAAALYPRWPAPVGPMLSRSSGIRRKRSHRVVVARGTVRAASVE